MKIRKEQSKQKDASISYLSYPSAWSPIFKFNLRGTKAGLVFFYLLFYFVQQNIFLQEFALSYTEYWILDVARDVQVGGQQRGAFCI